jgi:hypothetical protein
MKTSATALTLAALVVAAGLLTASTTLTAAFASPDESATKDAATHATATSTSVTVEDTRDIRCYFRADLERTYPAPNAPGITMPPFLLTGTMAAGFDSNHNPTPQDPRSGMLHISDPAAACSDLWDRNFMNPGGITSSFIPADFISPPSTAGGWDGQSTDAQGKPLISGPSENHTGHYVPQLTDCVVDDTVSVIPGPADICNKLGIAALTK